MVSGICCDGVRLNNMKDEILAQKEAATESYKDDLELFFVGTVGNYMHY